MYYIECNQRGVELNGNTIWWKYFYTNSNTFGTSLTDIKDFKTREEAEKIITNEKNIVKDKFEQMEKIGLLGDFTAKEMYSSWLRTRIMIIRYRKGVK